ncbi:hypothetical protein [Micromonospora sp. KC721]|uniref:hypothetical protein n=1 Tax=Micromonospora sp. KC721 TaxID=2530380 RepID=UPI0010460615|nr:hypothetical protein [Micromonospora sp. KC721]TDB79620.1 hypothetical protein E1182_12065 [Micromonospora sp. KC721]
MLAVEEVPKITDWMQAWGSLAGLLMSTVAVLFTGLLFRHEIRVRREEQRDNEAAQARLVVARPIAMKRDGERSDEITHVGCLITNYSSMPIFNLTVRLYVTGYLDSIGDEPALFSVVQDDVAWTAALRWPVRDSDLLQDEFYCVLDFVDSAGLSWRRSGLHLPTRQIIPEPRLATRLRVSASYWLRASLIGLRRLPSYLGYLIRRTRSR